MRASFFLIASCRSFNRHFFSSASAKRCKRSRLDGGGFFGTTGSASFLNATYITYQL